MVRYHARDGTPLLVGVLLCSLLVSASVSGEETVSPPAGAPPPSLTPQAGSSDAAEAAVAPMRLSMDFQQAKLVDVLKAFAQQTGINVIAAAEIAEKPVTIYFENVQVLDALDQILSAGNLIYERPVGSDIYIVRPKPADAATKTVTRVYRLKYARVSESILAKAATAFGARTPFEAHLKSSEDGEEGGNQASGAGVGAGIDWVLKRLLTKDGDIAVDGRTNCLIITDVPANFPRLEAAIAALVVKTPQIMVDAELVETTLTKLKDLGVEWGTGSEGDLISFIPGSAGRQTRFPFNLFGQRLDPTGPTPFPTSKLSFNSFQGVLQALENDNDTKILARPKVLTLDNESAVIRLTAKEAVGFETSTTTTTTTSEPIRENTGVVLVVTPQVNSDGYITMIVEPSVSKTVASQVTPPSGTGSTRDPKTRSSRTMVRIRSGDTLVVGGLIDRSDQGSLRRVPVLSGIPVLGEAFKNTETNNTATELIVFVTPRILDESVGERQVVASGPPVPWSAAQAGPSAAALRTGATGTAAQAERASMTARAQDQSGSRQDVIEQTLNRLE